MVNPQVITKPFQFLFFFMNEFIAILTSPRKNQQQWRWWKQLNLNEMSKSFNISPNTNTLMWSTKLIIPNDSICLKSIHWCSKLLRVLSVIWGLFEISFECERKIELNWRKSETKILRFFPLLKMMWSKPWLRAFILYKNS